ncbi:methyltransferase domain-containing protein [Colletotrichum musicola]|uniref:Methyltransferase domain-containing protein n=1 Tax=Colletotrichum musicola TaxID=2175873 RepID=A0A8H6KDJ8_9PEZI|nr:methyltransferase domain-containing protein [Colletotrichum musicola]
MLISQVHLRIHRISRLQRGRLPYGKRSALPRVPSRHPAYYGPNDEQELERLDFMSNLLIKLTKGKLHHAPLKQEKVHRILDIGTGTGIWAVEIADMFPDAEVIGNDLSPVQTTWVPPNVKFEVDDVESPWVGRKYDFIFSRFMAGAIADWPKLVKNTFELFMECSRKLGRDPAPGPQLPQWMHDAGFINIHHKKIRVPLGTWPRDPHLKEIGHMNMIQALDGLEAYNLRHYTGVLGWTKEEALALFANVRKEMRSNAFHAMIDYHVVYGQVPEAK